MTYKMTILEVTKNITFTLWILYPLLIYFIYVPRSEVWERAKQYFNSELFN